LFMDFIKMSLWSNKCDLSLSAGNSTTLASIRESVEKLQKFVLVDNTLEVYEYLEGLKGEKEVVIDIILDNSGMELFTDVVLADFLLTSKLCARVNFHPKLMPWFVSDVTIDDFDKMFEKLASWGDEGVDECCRRWRHNMRCGKFTVVTDTLDFYTMGIPYSEMINTRPQLYKKLQQSDLLIFKGDLNYRKLVGDLNWPATTPFKDGLQGFNPTKLVALRTLKADVVVGLDDGVENEMPDSDWMITGKYAVVQALL